MCSPLAFIHFIIKSPAYVTWLQERIMFWVAAVRDSRGSSDFPSSPWMQVDLQLYLLGVPNPNDTMAKQMMSLPCSDQLHLGSRCQWKCALCGLSGKPCADQAKITGHAILSFWLRPLCIRLIRVRSSVKWPMFLCNVSLIASWHTTWGLDRTSRIRGTVSCWKRWTDCGLSLPEYRRSVLSGG